HWGPSTKRKDRSDEKSKDRSKDKGAAKESSEKDRGRDETSRRRSTSSGSSNTRSRSSSTCSSGSSSSSASSRSGSSSTSRSSSSGSSPGSPSPSRRRQDNARRSRSKSKPPRRDEKERKRRSPSPKPTTVHIGRLTRNKGCTPVESENPGEAEKALKHVDGGHIDGQETTATAVPSLENAATASHVAQVPSTDEEEVAFPSAQVPGEPAPQEPLQLQLLRISRATEALPSEGGSVGKKSLTQGQASEVKAVVAMFPLAAEFRLQGHCWFGAHAYKDALQFSG
ncbi:hypothetical protein EI555_015692, partial [Monodon monoceros]